MRYVRGISLFLIFILLSLGIGFYAGVKSSPFFYGMPFLQSHGGEPYQKEVLEDVLPEPLGEAAEAPGSGGALAEDMEKHSGAESVAGDSPQEEAEEVMISAETLCVDTDYVLEETDILNHTVVETTWRLPEKYVGMDRERFLKAMEVYEAFPPLTELERGFVGLEVLAFSRERVVVRMDYKFVQPSSSFYLAVYDNKVVVYLEDMRTVYIETEIRLDSLPQHLQQSIIDMMWIRDEEELYSFLENYSS